MNFFSCFLFLILSTNVFTQEKESIIFLFDQKNDTLILRENSEIYSIDKLHTFRFTDKKNKKFETKYSLIKNKIVLSYSSFEKKDRIEKYPEYFDKYHFYIFIREEKDLGCLIEVEKVWLVEDYIRN